VQKERERPAYPIASVDNALRLLLMFRSQQRVRLSEASEFLGVAHSTAHRLLAMLSYHDFVRQEPAARTYVPGPALVDVGLAAVRNMDIRALARPLLEQLTKSLGETTHVVQLEGGMARYLDAVESPLALRVTARTGNLQYAHCTASGKALLAALSSEALRTLLPPGARLPAQTPRSITSRRELEQQLATVRELGYAVNAEESEEGVLSIAVAVRGPGGAPAAALAVSAPIGRVNDQKRAEIVHQLHVAAQQLGRDLGGEPVEATTAAVATNGPEGVSGQRRAAPAPARGRRPPR
jgi:IclR family acetate operon transcriptional repressor